MEFTNDIKSPAVQCEHAHHWPWGSTKDLDEFTIRKVGFKVHPHSGCVDAMKLYDENDTVVEEKRWNEDDGASEWVEQDIPENKEIIGFQCNTDRGHEIVSLGLLVWTPSPGAA